MNRPAPPWRICGIDFTSRPRPRKPITIACGRLRRIGFVLEDIEECADWAGFEAWLRRPGPWIAGCDFPFGLPRQAVADLGWPLEFAELVRYCQALGRDGFRAVLDAYRQTRAAGDRYAHRAADRPARSHSPLKLVNPPVGLMFLEGVPRLLDAGVTLPGMLAGDPLRIALEAYPGFGVRQVCRDPYKNDDTARQTPARRRARKHIVERLGSADNPLGFPLRGKDALLDSLVRDPSGDRLDAAVCAMQAAWCWLRRDDNYGLPAGMDPLEGWIATVPE